MRAITLAILLLPSVASADSFFQISGGLSVPVGDQDWDDAAESSPKLAVRGGGGGRGSVGAVISADWAPQRTDAQEFFGNSVDISAHRFRLLIGPGFAARVAPGLTFTSRLGIGADIAYFSAKSSVFGATFESSDTDVGFAFEIGAGLWANVGSMQLGAEVALPIGHHDHRAENNDEITMEWTSYDFDILFGVRFLQ